MRFIVYNHVLISDNVRISRKFIVLKSDDGTLQFTNFHKYVFSPKSRTRHITADGNNRFAFIVQLLNYAFFVCDIESLSDITVDIVSDFLMDYGNCELPDDTEYTSRSKSTVERCITVIMDFLENLLAVHGKELSFKGKDLYQEIKTRDKRGRVISKKVPVFTVFYKGCNTTHVYRDMPNEAFKIIYGYIYENHKELLALISLSAFAGLRPSEACNVRREDSPLGSGFIIDMVGEEVTKIKIDLRHEYVLRSDMISVGRIKKENLREIPDIFLEPFLDAYTTYMHYIEGRKYEKDYGPLSINRQGKAYIYASYRRQFQNIIQEEIVPIFLQSDNPELVIYGRTLMEHRISPHIFRHWYTVQLVLSGISDPGTLMFYRGDASPESSLTYLKNKGELEREYRKVNNEAFAYLKWASERQHND